MSCSRSSRVHARADLDAHDLAEAPPAQLVLDGLQQVVGLVGDLEVGVARDAEDVVVEDLHAREQLVEVRGDDLLERDERAAVARPATKRGSISFGTFTRANVSCPVRGSRTSTASDSDRFEMYGNGRPRPTASGVSDREDLAAEALGRAPRGRGRETSSQPTMRMPCSASAGRSSLVARSASGARAARGPLARIASIVSAGVRPSAPRRRRCPASTWSCRPATRTMKNSSRFDE